MEQKQVSLNEVYKVLLELKAKMNKMDQYIEDLEFARRTEEAWREIDEGKGKTYSLNELKKRLKGWYKNLGKIKKNSILHNILIQIQKETSKYI